MKEACAESGVSLRKLQREISKSLSIRNNPLPNPATAELDALTKHIETYHHHFTSEIIVFINTSLNRLVRLHGGRFPELSELKTLFDEVSGPLLIHMQHEEFIVFPYIRELVKKKRRVKSSIYRSADSPIPGMLAGHEKGPEYLKRLNTLTHQFSPPNEQGSAFKVTYAAMRELERDLNTHLRLESEVLFPRALELEIRINIASTQTPSRN
jgi:regulator of cell morphogenesis and NO signaling